MHRLAPAVLVVVLASCMSERVQLATAAQTRMVGLTKAEQLARGIAEAFPSANAVVGPADATGYELVVNATPIGMAQGDPSPIDSTGFHSGMVVADVIILAHDTPLLAAARQRGCGLMGGRPMTEGQAHEMARFLGMSA